MCPILHQDKNNGHITSNRQLLLLTESLPKFLKGAWPQKTDYGFKAEDEQNDVSLAEPILVYSIDEEIVGKLNREEDLASAVELIGELIYPVQVKQEYRTLFGVRLRGNEWRGLIWATPILPHRFKAFERRGHQKMATGSSWFPVYNLALFSSLH